MPFPAAVEPADDPVDLDLFAGPGGWDEGVRPLGVRPLGIEWDEAACATARAAGHRRLQADIAALSPRGILTEHFGEARTLRGLIASPPCQGFSTAGKGRGRDDAALLLEAIPHMPERDVRAELHERMTDDRSVLVLEPLRWALELAPEWMAWEQVPAVLPIWEACAAVLRLVGYTVATGILNSEQHGVPQTRRRAVLVARSAVFSRTHGRARLPEPTHSRYYSANSGQLDMGVLPWVSMAEALGWGMTHRPSMTVTGGGTSAGGAEPFGNGARKGMVREREAGRWAFAGAGPAALRTAGQVPRPATSPAHAVTGAATAQWVRYPALAGQDPRVGSERVTVAEASVLQSFPADYPWQGTKTAQYRQVGDAMPPLLACAVISGVADLAQAAGEETFEGVA